MSQRILGTLDTPARPAVVVEAFAKSAGLVVLRVQRDSRREAKLDREVTLTASDCRQLMRQLQAAADRADQLAYRADHPPALDVSSAVEWLDH